MEHMKEKFEGTWFNHHEMGPVVEIINPFNGKPKYVSTSKVYKAKNVKVDVWIENFKIVTIKRRKSIFNGPKGFRGFSLGMDDPDEGCN